MKSTELEFRGKELGRGSFARVEQASLLGTTVAVKKMKIVRAARVKRLALKEVEVHSRLHHPNIVQLMGVCFEAGEIWIVSEFVAGGNLEQLIYGSKNDVRLSVPEKLTIAVQCVQGMAYLHGTSPPVVHMDIKPQNILVTKNNIPKICDFGLSKSKRQIKATVTWHPGQCMGTPYYMAPELLLGTNTASCADPACDIWSLAATLVELFAETDLWFPDHDEGCDGDSDDFDAICAIKEKMEKRIVPPSIAAVDSRVQKALADCLVYVPEFCPLALGMLEKMSEISIK